MREKERGMDMALPYQVTSQQQAYQKYQQTSVQTATPGQLLLMLYDGCIRFLNQAKQAIHDQNMEQAHINLVKAQNIITELMVTLNLDIPISHNLYQLYDFYKRQLIEANLKKTVEPIETTLAFFQDMRKTWAEAIVKAASEQAAAAIGDTV
jgi:flagellar secretion chaperone FliS